MGVTGAAKLLPPAVRPLVRRELVRWRHVGLRPSDVLLVSYPKSGSTWLRFLLAHALTAEGADFDSVRDTVPKVGRHRRAPALLPDDGRLLRSHEPAAPFRGRAGQRVISLVRDGRKVALSYMAHERRYGRFDGSGAEFVDRFLRGEIDSYGAWHDHVLAAAALEQSGAARVLRVRYEDLRGDTVAELSRILDFCGMGTRSPAQPSLEEVVESNTKERMHEKEAQSAFLGTMANDGSPLVRPDRASEWVELVEPDARRRFEAVCGPALRTYGYEVADPAGSSGAAP